MYATYLLPIKLNRMKIFYRAKFILVISILLSTSCSNKNNKTENNIIPTEKNINKLPEGAVLFEYDEKMLKLIFLEGRMNDSVNLKIFFDTGVWGLILPNKYKTIADGDEPITIQIDKWKYCYNTLRERDAFSEGHHMEQILGSNTAIIGWDFFRGKIIEISFRNKYIRELTKIKDLPSGYDSLSIKPQLGIPVKVVIQGKKINEYLLLDTGANGSITFNEDILQKYDLDLDRENKKATVRIEGKAEMLTHIVDTIYLGKSFVTNHNVAFAAKGVNKRSFSGLLGTKVLEKFDIILDLKNYVFYFKLISEEN